MTTHDHIAQGLSLIFRGIKQLQEAFDHRAFTVDGRLVGDVGEVVAEINYALVLDKKSRKGYDAKTLDGKDIQIKATFKDSLTFRYVPELYLGFKLHEDGTFEEVFNGPGSLIYERFSKRKGIGIELLSFPLADLRALSKQVPSEQRVLRKMARADVETAHTAPIVTGG
eukprot:gene42972-53321_t